LKLLRAKIPNAQKRLSSQKCCFARLGPTSVKAVCKMLVKFAPEVCACPRECVREPRGVWNTKFMRNTSRQTQKTLSLTFLNAKML